MDSEDATLLDSSRDLFDDVECNNENQECNGNNMDEHPSTSRDAEACLHAERRLSEEAKIIVHNVFSNIRNTLDTDCSYLSKGISLDADRNSSVDLISSDTFLPTETFPELLRAEGERNSKEDHGTLHSKKRYRSHDEDRATGSWMRDALKDEILNDPTQRHVKDGMSEKEKADSIIHDVYLLIRHRLDTDRSYLSKNKSEDVHKDSVGIISSYTFIPIRTFSELLRASREPEGEKNQEGPGHSKKSDRSHEISLGCVPGDIDENGTTDLWMRDAWKIEISYDPTQQQVNGGSLEKEEANACHIVHNVFSLIRNKLNANEFTLSKSTLMDTDTGSSVDIITHNLFLSQTSFSDLLAASSGKDVDDEHGNLVQAKKRFRSHGSSLGSLHEVFYENGAIDLWMKGGCKVEILYEPSQPMNGDNVKVLITMKGATEQSQEEAAARSSQSLTDIHGLDKAIVSGDQMEVGPAAVSTSAADSPEIVEVHSDDELEISCPFCNRKESTVERLQTHISLEHPDISSNHTSSSVMKETRSAQDLSINLEGDVFQFVCPMCDIDIGDALTLQLHIDALHAEEHHTGPVAGGQSCPLCDVICASEQAMEQHIKTHDNDQTFYGVSAAGEVAAASFSPPDLSCPMCGLLIQDTDLLTSHVESHFNPKHSPGPSSLSASEVTVRGNKENVPMKKNGRPGLQRSQEVKRKPSNGKEASPSTSRSGWSPASSKENVSYRRQYEQNLERAVVQGRLTVADYYEQRQLISNANGFDNEQTRTDGLIAKLQGLYNHQARAGQTVHLCSDTAHFSGSYGDKGWGCGYRNFQMLMSCLIRNPDYSSRIFEDGLARIPSIPKIQRMLESAWRKGFDPQGCQQLGGRVVDTRKWIGATEIVTLLSSLGIKCRLLDFHAPTASDGTHPRLFEWVADYFTVRQQQFLPPLYLQHQGHSRTIVGVDVDRGSTRLLLFDPGTPKDHMTTLMKGHLAWKDMRTFRRTLAGFKAKQYQIVAVTGLLSDIEYQDSKILQSDWMS